MLIRCAPVHLYWRLQNPHPSTAMTIIKRFAEDGTALDDCMDRLVEALTQLLDENPVPAPMTDLHSNDTRGIHVVRESKK